MEEPEESNLPGLDHEILTRRAGTYKAVAVWRMTPDDEPLMVEGEAKFESILGDGPLRSFVD